MNKALRAIIILAAIIIGLVTVSSWAPIVAYGPLIMVSKVLNGHCRGSPVYLRLAGAECGNSDESPVTRENANTPIGYPSECPLLAAVSFNNAIIVKDLITNGANPALCQGFPDAFFDRATNCSTDPKKAAEIFAELERLGIRTSNSNHLLMSQAKAKCVPGIELAVAQGADVNAGDHEGHLALHYTTQSTDDGSILATAALVRLGADPQRRNSTNDSPYAQARERLHTTGNWPRLESALTGKAIK